ncbi:MAG TPA: deoxyribose-phosphate aldolase [Dongiaceae bacterium]
MAAKPTDDQAALARRLIPLLDLTSLNEDDTPEKIAALCKRAVTPFGPVAAVCIYPRFVKQAKELLAGSKVRIATVANFPAGTGLPDDIERAIAGAVADGADEIDMVIPPLDYVPTQRFANRRTVMWKARKACDGHPMKVILETGRYRSAGADPQQLFAADVELSEMAILEGADFIKTSTGKAAVNATPDAAAAMLQTIRFGSQDAPLDPASPPSGEAGDYPGVSAERPIYKCRYLRTDDLPVGFKAAGGIRTVAQAKTYVDLAERIMGPGYVEGRTFRIGASGLLDDVLSQLGQAPAPGARSAY